MEAEQLEENLQSPEPKPGKIERGRSTIEWPYFSLEESYKLARAVFELGGTCQVDQLAGHMNQAAGGGAFRLKLQAARTFGLITTSQGNASLSELGSQMMESETEREARAQAFLNVPLYSALYESYKGKTLPGNTGLEGAMVNLGVVANQKEKARQTFQRSARDAGFFTYGSTRLVYPVMTQDKSGREQRGSSEPPPPSSTVVTPPATSGGGGGNGSGTRLHPFIQGLLEELPPPKTDWPMEARRKWLQSALGIFDLIYEGAISGESLTIKAEKTSAN